MAERTVWSNRLIDWLKLDAIVLNGTDWIDAQSIADWTVSDTEFLYLHGLTWPIQDQIDWLGSTLPTGTEWDMLYHDWSDWVVLSPWTDWQFVKYVDWVPTPSSLDSWDVSLEDPTINDSEDLTDWWANTVTPDDTNNWVKVTHPDWSYTIYGEDWIWEYDNNWELVSFTGKTGTYDDGSDTITYDDWTVIDWGWWTISTTDWKIAYKNQPNTFTETNVFEWDSVFKGNVAFPYYQINMDWITTIAFDWDNWQKQRTIYHNTWWTHTLNFTNIYSGSNYSLMIRNISWWDITLKLGSAYSVSWEWMWIYWIWFTDNLTLSDTTGWWGLHLFIMETFDTWIHMSYVWESKVITTTP